MLRLNIYTDETFTKIRETRERERIKIPYIVAQYVLRRVLQSEQQVTMVVRATFGLVEADLQYIDTLEMTAVAGEVIQFVLDKMAELGIATGADDPNTQAPATTA